MGYRPRGGKKSDKTDLLSTVIPAGTSLVVQWLRLLKFSTNFQFSSVQFSRSVVSDSLRLQELQHARPPWPSPTPGVHSDSGPSSQ